MAVMNDAQLSNYSLTVSILQKGYLCLLFCPQLFSVLLSLLIGQLILHRKPMECKISIHCLFVCLFLTAANAFGTPRSISGSRNSNDVLQLQNVINKH